MSNRDRVVSVCCVGLVSLITLDSACRGQSSDFQLRVIAAPVAPITNIGAGTSINNEGVVAYTANDAAGSRVWVGLRDGYLDSTPTTTQVVTSIVGSNRTFAGVGLTSGPDPYVIARELVSGAPPNYIVRRWRVSDTTGVILGSTASAPVDFDSAVSFVDINNNLFATCVGLVNGSTSTRLFLGSARPLGQMFTSPGAVLLRPQIADDANVVVVREADGSIATWQPGAVRVGILGPGNDINVDLATTGNRPGISSDGVFVGFAGANTNGPAVIISWLPASGSRRYATVAGGTLGDGFTAFPQDQRVGLFRRSLSPVLSEVSVVFVGVRNGVTGAYQRRMFIDDSVPTFWRSEPSAVVRVGDNVAGLSGSVTGVTLYDPMSSCGAVGLSVTTSAGAAVLRADPGARSTQPLPSATLYSQANGPWAPLCLKSGFNPPNCPTVSGRSITFQKSGCIITAFATAVGLELDRVGASSSTTRPNPLQTRDYLQAIGAVVGSHGEVNGERLAYATGDWNVVTERSSDSTFETILTELRQGKPVILAVPSRTRSVTQTKNRDLHYIVAYAYDEAKGSASGAPFGIMISDPGNGDSAYNTSQSGTPLAGFVPPAAPRHITLHDYFAATSRRSVGGTGGNAQFDYFGVWGDCPARDASRIRDWFDRGVFWRINDQGDSVEEAVIFPPEFPRWKLITKLRTTQLTSVLYPPSIGIASPVEMVLSAAGSTVRYVTTPSLAQPGDIVLPKSEVPPVAAEDEGDGVATDAFPPYFVDLPAALYGVEVNYQLVGVGDGPYTVTYCHRGSDFTPPPAVVGVIANGQTISGVFTPTPASHCDSVDFNGDALFPDTQDIADFLTVFAGGVCDGQQPGDPPCNTDVDFNNDTLFPDVADIDSLLSVFSGGPCL